MEHQKTIDVSTTDDIKADKFDCLVVVLETVPLKSSSLSFLDELAEQHKKILSFTGPLDREFDDIRRVIEAAKEGISKAIKTGARNPVLALDKLPTLDKLGGLEWTKAPALCLSTLLGALEGAFVPLEAREFSLTKHASIKSVKGRLLDSLGWFADPNHAVDHKELAHTAWCLEEGRRVARDIGGCDPERMRPSSIAEYLQTELEGSDVKMTSCEVDPTKFPTAAAVDRGSSDRHKGRIVELEYDEGDESSCDKKHIFMVGKGITYDTGGHDIKYGGIMVHMHRDKCGAAAVAGFFKVLSLLKPTNIGVHGKMAFVRNSIGVHAYVSDEIITTRAGLRVRVGNTDAEGRMVMTDLLCKAKEEALLVKNAHLFTIATLTGHVRIAYGIGYTALVSNGSANLNKTSLALQAAGYRIGEMHEISTLRREDYTSYEQADQDADLNNTAAPIDGRRSRGHQGPAAFMMMASGLDNHSVNSERPLAYTHLDIAGSNGPCPGVPSGVPVLTFASHLLLGNLLK